MAVRSDRAVIEVELPEPFDDGWNRIVGITVEGHRLKIVPDLYFFRYENPTWIVCDWARVTAELLPARETSQWTIEQQACDYVREHGCVTSDPAEVLRVAWEVNAWMFRDELLSEPGLAALGVQPRHTRMLREVTTLMALNRVELTGEISNVGPAWMFPIACQVVYGLDDAETELLDELYHPRQTRSPTNVVKEWTAGGQQRGTADPKRTWFGDRVTARACLRGCGVLGCPRVPARRRGCALH